MHTEEAVARVRWLIRSGTTPPAVFEPKCRRCSLAHLCLPNATSARRSATAYLQRALAHTRDAGPPAGQDP
jgi:CRISPR-associated exonuclease Cas4